MFDFPGRHPIWGFYLDSIGGLRFSKDDDTVIRLPSNELLQRNVFFEFKKLFHDPKIPQVKCEFQSSGGNSMNFLFSP